MISGFALKSVSVQMMKTFSVNYERFSVWASEMFSLGERTSGEEPRIQFRERTMVGWYLSFPSRGLPWVPRHSCIPQGFVHTFIRACIKLYCNHFFMQPSPSLHSFKCLETEALPYFFLYTWLLLENRGLIVEWTKEKWKNGGK